MMITLMMVDGLLLLLVVVVAEQLYSISPLVSVSCKIPSLSLFCSILSHCSVTCIFVAARQMLLQKRERHFAAVLSSFVEHVQSRKFSLFRCSITLYGSFLGRKCTTKETLGEVKCTHTCHCRMH